MPQNNDEQMVLGSEAFDCGIQKSLVHAGKTPVEFVDGTKVYFHYKTIIQENGTVLDDSKKLHPKPMELIIGKKFKLEIWERALKTMRINEVAKFSVVKELLFDYPVVAKQLREYYETLREKEHDHCHSHDHDHGHSHDHGHAHKTTQNHRHHCCGYNLMEHGVGYSDLDDLLKNPKGLDFVLELVKVDKPGEYKKDPWSLSEEERLTQIPILKEEGNLLFKEKKYDEASHKYEEAIGFLEQLILKEKPNDTEWNELMEKKLTLLLNFSLCKFNLNDFYGCIEHTSTILEHQPNNVKALFRRAKAYGAVWSFDEAKRDFNLCTKLDPTLSKDVEAQINYLNQVELKHKREEKEKFKGKLFT